METLIYEAEVSWGLPIAKLILNKFVRRHVIF